MYHPSGPERKPLSARAYRTRFDVLLHTPRPKVRRSKGSRRRFERKPPHCLKGSTKNAPKNSRSSCRPMLSRYSPPKAEKSRLRLYLSDHIVSHTCLAARSPSPACVESARSIASAVSAAIVHVRDTMYPVAGCTSPAEPPKPMTRCGTTGIAPPIGIRHSSSSSTSTIFVPQSSRRLYKRRFRSSNGTGGLSMREVSSKKTVPLSVGMQ
mmetsp:Transcript_53912/g.128128  ORF Transcript_53912/g.128128 Transcript_53912/m.128128 type:complete len:210 (+) Transcript_53912:228-857(+)